MRSLSSRAASRALAAAVVGAARWVNSRYEQYLERSFPRFYILHSTFKTGETRGRVLKRGAWKRGVKKWVWKRVGGSKKG